MSIARSTTMIQRAAALPMGLLDRIDASLDAGFTRVDSIIDRGIQTTNGLTMSFGRGIAGRAQATDIALDQRLANSDAKTRSRIARFHTCTRNLAGITQNLEARLDSRLELNLQTADRISAICSRAAVASGPASVRFAEQLDKKLTREFNKADSCVTNRINEISLAVASTLNLVDTKAEAFERALELGITRIDYRLERRVDQAVAAKKAAVAGVIATDHSLDRGFARLDRKFNNRISQGTNAYSSATNLASNRIATFDSNLAKWLTTSDTRIETAVSTVVTAATGVAHFVSDRADNADVNLTRKLSRIDARVDALVVETNGNPSHAGKRTSAAPPWVATSLTLVLGTLGAATGASAINASGMPVEIDTTVKIEASAAKDAVTQYLSVRESFQALRADRSRTIQTLENEIAAAQARVGQVTLDGNAVIDVADNYSGVPYVRGGTTPKGFDCSGYTSYVFAQFGIDLPRTSQAQAAWADPVSFEDRQVGDLMFWQGGGIRHVGIYAGDGMMWDSPYPGRRVGKKPIWGQPTYGRVPVSAINGKAVAEVAAKTAELDALRAAAPQLEITIAPQNLPPALGK